MARSVTTVVTTLCMVVSIASSRGYSVVVDGSPLTSVQALLPPPDENAIDGLIPVDVSSTTVNTETISLYDETDAVVDLLDSNFTSSVYGSDKLWIVEFYMHWCGHCQRFRSVWKEAAETFEKWGQWVKFGAINCAQQYTCGEFGINGVPTVRLIYPYTSFHSMERYGIDIQPRHLHHYWKMLVLQHLEILQSESRTSMDGLPDLSSFKPTDGIGGLHDIFKASASWTTEEHGNSQSPKRVAFILENQADAIGREAIFQLHDKHHPSLKIRRVAWADIGLFLTLFPKMQLQQFPALMLVQPSREASFPWKMWIHHPVSYLYSTRDSYNAAIIESIDEFLTEISMAPEGEEEQQQDEASTTATSSTFRPISASPETAVATSTPAETLFSNASGLAPASTARSPPQETEDVVHASDLEKAIKHSVMTEIQMLPELSNKRLQAIYQWLSVSLKYLPLRKPVWKFLTALKWWLFELGPVSLAGSEFRQVVGKLAKKYGPWVATPRDWEGCKGSEPHLRGYTCALWQTFHALSVKASVDDKQNVFNEIAPAVVAYVSEIFSCRHCSNNFLLKVKRVNGGALPSSPFDTMLWLWQIHNMANSKLRGDATEDPMYPKSLWPSTKNCPECRPASPWEIPAHQQYQLQTFEGEIWNVKATTDYLKQVYGRDIKPFEVGGNEDYSEEPFDAQPPADVEVGSEQTVPDTDLDMADLMKATLRQLKEENRATNVDLGSLEIINKYCANAFKILLGND